MATTCFTRQKRTSCGASGDFLKRRSPTAVRLSWQVERPIRPSSSNGLLKSRSCSTKNAWNQRTVNQARLYKQLRTISLHTQNIVPETRRNGSGSANASRKINDGVRRFRDERTFAVVERFGLCDAEMDFTNSGRARRHFPCVRRLQLVRTRRTGPLGQATKSVLPTVGRCSAVGHSSRVGRRPQCGRRQRD